MFLSLKLIKKIVKCLYTYIELKIICKYKIDLHRKSRGRLSEWEEGGLLIGGLVTRVSFVSMWMGFSTRGLIRGGGGLIIGILRYF